MIKSHKMMFILTLTTSTLIVISSHSWLSMWIGLEMNLMSMIPLMNEELTINSPESLIKYFITQVLASSTIMMCLIMESLKNMMSNITLKTSFTLMLASSLLMKMGVAPFHLWFPEIMESMSWPMCLLLITWQKIAPMSILMSNFKFNMYTLIIIIISLIVSSTMIINQSSLRKIIAYSSINNMGWMLSTIMISKTIWMVYFLVYSLINSSITLIFQSKKIYKINQINNLSTNILEKLSISINFLSISGMPPFIGFLSKWLTINALISNKLIMLSSIMVILSVLMNLTYIKITMNCLFKSMMMMKWKINESMIMKPMLKINLLMFNSINFSSLMLMTSIFNMI